MQQQEVKEKSRSSATTTIAIWADVTPLAIAWAKCGALAQYREYRYGIVSAGPHVGAYPAIKQ